MSRAKSTLAKLTYDATEEIRAQVVNPRIRGTIAWLVETATAAPLVSAKTLAAASSKRLAEAQDFLTTVRAAG